MLFLTLAYINIYIYKYRRTEKRIYYIFYIIILLNTLADIYYIYIYILHKDQQILISNVVAIFSLYSYKIISSGFGFLFAPATNAIQTNKRCLLFALQQTNTVEPSVHGLQR